MQERRARAPPSFWPDDPQAVFSRLATWSCPAPNIHREGKSRAAQFTAIGALSGVVLLYLDWTTKAYEKILMPEQVEVASLVGDVAENPSGGAAIYARRRQALQHRGGRPSRPCSPTLEVFVTESPASA
jgi:predicted DNA-binding protein with PD1-like motif